MLKRILAGTVALVAVFIFSTTLVHALLYVPENDVAVNSDAQDSAQMQSTHKNATPGDYPVRLQVPSLNINAAVQYVGITAHGTMAVPNNFTDVGWYKYGPVPGTDGSAVLAGHVDNALALPGVFKHLQDIQPGADVYVVTKDGNTLHFLVDDVETYDAENAPTDKIFDQSELPRLTLITCEGTWIQSEHQYDHRLVVYTHLAE